MEIVLTRIAKRKLYTIGRLAIVERVDDEMTEQREQSQACLSTAESQRNSNKIQYLAGQREVYFCDTLEPPVIEQKTEVPVSAVLRSPVKLASIKPVAIPEGRYAVVISYSPKFKAWLPVLLGGPDFNRLWQGIRIHAGNTVADTRGCILPGRNQRVGQVLESRKWLYELKQKIVEAKARGEAVWITIK